MFIVQPQQFNVCTFRAESRYTIVGVVLQCSDSLLRVLEVFYCTCLTEQNTCFKRCPLDAHNNLHSCFLTSKLRFNWYRMCVVLFNLLTMFLKVCIFTFYLYFSFKISHIWVVQLAFAPLYDSHWLAYSLLTQTLSLLWTYSFHVSECIIYIHKCSAL